MLSLTVIGALLAAGCSAESTANPKPTSEPASATEGLTPASTRTSRPMPTSSPTATPQPTAEPIAIEPDSLRDTLVHFVFPWAGNLASAGQGLVDAFNQQNQWGISVKATFTGSTDLLRQSLYGVGEADLPHGVLLSAEDARDWTSNGNRLLDLSAYMIDPQFGLPSGYRQQLLPGYLQQFNDQDTLFGLPLEQNVFLLFYNQTWAEELGFEEPPASLTEFEQQVCAAAKALTRDEDPLNDGMGGWVLSYDSGTVLSWLAAYQSPNPMQGQPASATFQNEQNESAYAALRTLYNSGCLWQARLPSSETYFAQRRALMYSGTLEDIRLQQATQTRLGSADVWTVIPYPSTTGEPVLLSRGAGLVVIPSTPEQDLAAWLFMSWLTQPEQAAALTRAGAWLPVDTAQADLLGEFSASNPQWAAVLAEQANVQPLPQTPEWLMVEPILEDSFRQLFRPLTEVDNVDRILTVIDSTIEELLDR